VPLAPVGLFALDGYEPYQSQHHSHTLPVISYKPAALGALLPTGCVVPPELASYQATSSMSSLPAYVELYLVMSPHLSCYIIFTKSGLPLLKYQSYYIP